MGLICFREDSDWGQPSDDEPKSVAPEKPKPEPITLGTFPDIEDALRRRAINALYLTERLEANGLGAYLIFTGEPEDRIWITYPLVLKPEWRGVAMALMDHLRSQSIEFMVSGQHFAIHVPCHQDLTLEDMHRIFQAIHEFFMQCDPSLRLRIMEYEI